MVPHCGVLHVDGGLVNVSAVIVTRGDVDLQPVLDSLPGEWETIVWVNSGPLALINTPGTYSKWLTERERELPDLSVYGRYAAIEWASNDMIYVQDDDVIVSDPQAIVDVWHQEWRGCVQGKSGMINLHTACEEFVVCNMPEVFRPHYPDAALVGFGAAFHRDAPARAFERYFSYGDRAAFIQASERGSIFPSWTPELFGTGPVFNRECDRVFTVLTPRVLVDVDKADREFAKSENRLYREPGHNASTKRMLDLARKVRDGS